MIDIISIFSSSDGYTGFILGVTISILLRIFGIFCDFLLDIFCDIFVRFVKFILGLINNKKKQDP